MALTVHVPSPVAVITPLVNEQCAVPVETRVYVMAPVPDPPEVVKVNDEGNVTEVEVTWSVACERAVKVIVTLTDDAAKYEVFPLWAMVTTHTVVCVADTKPALVTEQPVPVTEYERVKPEVLVVATDTELAHVDEPSEGAVIDWLTWLVVKESTDPYTVPLEFTAFTW